MATLQKFKILATQCGVAQSPTRSPRTSPLVNLPRKKTTLRMLLTRNTSSRRTPSCYTEPQPLPSPKQIVADEKKRDGDSIAQRNNKLKDLFISSSSSFEEEEEEEEEEKVGDKISEKTEVLCAMKKLHGVGIEPGLSRPGWVGFRHRFLLRKAWRPMLDTIPEYSANFCS